MMATLGDVTDIDTIAEEWGVPRATAAYGLMAVELQRARGRAANCPVPLTLGLSAAVDLLRASGWDVKRRSGG